MGLDSYIFAKRIPNKDKQIFNKLVGEDEPTMEILYWRKEYGVVDFFGDILNVEIENCKDYELTKEDLILLKTSLENETLMYEDYEGVDLKIQNDIDKLKLVLKETDFAQTKFYFHNWW